jgi:hypothetical protein
MPEGDVIELVCLEVSVLEKFCALHHVYHHPTPGLLWLPNPRTKN